MGLYKRSCGVGLPLPTTPSPRLLSGRVRHPIVPDAAFAEEVATGRPKSGHPADAPIPRPTVHWRRGGRYSFPTTSSIAPGPLPQALRRAYSGGPGGDVCSEDDGEEEQDVVHLNRAQRQRIRELVEKVTGVDCPDLVVNDVVEALGPAVVNYTCKEGEPSRDLRLSEEDAVYLGLNRSGSRQ